MDYNRLLDKFDSLVYSGKFVDARELLESEKKRAKQCFDTTALLAINNELIGFYRKQNCKNECLYTINDTLTTLYDVKDKNSLFVGTIYINIATAYSFFNLYKKAKENFDIAHSIYKQVLDKDDKNFGALYNNIASMYLLEKEYNQARQYYILAVENATKNNSALDKAMSLVGICDTYDASDLQNEKIIDGLLNEAFALVENYPIKDNYFAFVCSKLMDNYAYYGYFIQAEMLKEWANERD